MGNRESRNANVGVSGRCYCGAVEFHSSELPSVVVYCHCDDCKRITGAPVAAFAAFKDQAITFSPNEGRFIAVNPGVSRSFCENCGTPLTGRYDYLPDTVYVALGVIDQASQLAPQLHAHESNRLGWLKIEDQCPRFACSAREGLNAATQKK